MEKRTADDAVAQLYKLLRARLDAEPVVLSDDDVAQTPEEIDALRLELIERLIRATCAEVARCGDRRCRRGGRCRRLTDLASLRSARDRTRLR